MVAPLTLAVNLSTSLYLSAGVYAILLERHDYQPIQSVLLVLLLPLVISVVAAAAAGYVVLGTGRRKKWRAVLLAALVALALALIPFRAVLAGDPSDAPEAAVRRNLGSGTHVSCLPSEQGSFNCNIRLKVDRLGGLIGGNVRCVVRLGSGGDIVTSDLYFTQSAFAPAVRFCRDLTR